MDIDKNWVGKNVSGWINHPSKMNGTPQKFDGKIMLIRDNYYILHNTPTLDGSKPEAMHMENYKYSWCVNSGDEKNLKSNYVKEITLINSTYELWS